MREEELVTEIVQEREKGFGFVPLVGAGLSAASGVPLINELQKYLQKCIGMALGVDRLRKLGALPQFQHLHRWHPQRNEWPSVDRSRIYSSDEIDWQQRIGHAAAAMQKEHAKGAQTAWLKFPEVRVFLEAYGATAEWRSSLNFLARLGEYEVGTQRILSLGSIDPHVHDSFFLSAVSGKTPTLGHQMLARLSNPLGVNTIVTLNFDDLLEQAFLEVDNPLTVYAVHQDAGLPPYHSKFGSNVLIKMHGDRYGLRADYSLDETPTDEDCRLFTSYLSSRHITPREWNEKTRKADGATSAELRQSIEARNHLLVVGLSVQEKRLLELIKTAHSALHSSFRVFWVLFRQQDIQDARKRVENLLGEGSEHIADKIVFAQHHNVGLLFYNIYQNLTGSIPPKGAIFPARARVSVPPGTAGGQHSTPSPKHANLKEGPSGFSVGKDLVHRSKSRSRS